MGIPRPWRTSSRGLTTVGLAAALSVACVASALATNSGLPDQDGAQSTPSEQQSGTANTATIPTTDNAPAPRVAGGTYGTDELCTPGVGAAHEYDAATGALVVYLENAGAPAGGTVTIPTDAAESCKADFTSITFTNTGAVVDELDIGDYAFAQNREWDQTDLVNPLKSVMFPEELRVLRIGNEGFHQFLMNDDYTTGTSINSLESVVFPVVVEEISLGRAAFMQRIAADYLNGENRLESVWFPDGLKKLTLDRKAIGQSGGRTGPGTRVTNRLALVSLPAGMQELRVAQEGISQSTVGQKDELPSNDNKLAVIEFRFSDRAGFPESMTIGDVGTTSLMPFEWLWYGSSGTMLDLWGTMPGADVGRLETGVCVAWLPSGDLEEIPGVGSESECKALIKEKEDTGEWDSGFWRKTTGVNTEFTLAAYQPAIFELDAGGSVSEAKAVTGTASQGAAPALTGSVCGADDPGADADVSRCQYVYPMRDTGAVSAAWDLEYPNTDLSAAGPVWPAFDSTATAANGLPIYNQFKVALPEVGYIWNEDEPTEWIYQFNGWCGTGLQENGRCQMGVAMAPGTALPFGNDASAAQRTWYAQWTIQKPTIAAATTGASGTGIPGATVKVFADPGGTTELCSATVNTDKTWSCSFAPGDVRDPGTSVWSQQSKSQVQPCCMIKADIPDAQEGIQVLKAALGDRGPGYDSAKGITTLTAAEFSLYSVVDSATACEADPTKRVAATSPGNYDLEIGGIYCLYEDKAPAGYELLPEPIRFEFGGSTATHFITILSGGENSVRISNSTLGDPWFSDDNQIYVIDTASLPMPAVGGAGSAIWLLTGALIFTAGAAALLRTRKMLDTRPRQ